jgi:hypothetical protein
MSGVTFNWYTLGGALIIAAAAATFAYYRYLQEQKHQRSTLLNALFSEIANIYEHYSYAAHEIPTTLEDEFEMTTCFYSNFRKKKKKLLQKDSSI